VPLGLPTTLTKFVADVLEKGDGPARLRSGEVLAVQAAVILLVSLAGAGVLRYATDTHDARGSLPSFLSLRWLSSRRLSAL